jgi:hypothetical protein
MPKGYASQACFTILLQVLSFFHLIFLFPPWSRNMAKKVHLLNESEVILT